MYARILVSLVLFALWGLPAKAQYTSDPLDQATVEQFIKANPDTKLKFIAAQKGGMLCKDAAVMARYKDFAAGTPAPAQVVADPTISNGAVGFNSTPERSKKDAASEARRAELRELIRKDPDHAGEYIIELKSMGGAGTGDH